MALPKAVITLLDSRQDRLKFADAAALRLQGTYTDGDLAQVYSLKRLYRFVSSSSDADDGVTTIQPSTLPVLGRWKENNVIQLTGADSIADSAITVYKWFLVSRPELPEDVAAPPLVQINPVGLLGVNLDVTVPTVAAWKAGGFMIFLKVTDSALQISRSNPFDPLLDQNALYKYILNTDQIGLEVAPAGSRSWHETFLRSMRAVDAGVGAALAVATPTHLTIANKTMSPSGATSGDQSIVPGVTMFATPDFDGYVRVYVNGVAYPVGDLDHLTKPCYFIPAAGPVSPAQAYTAIAAGDRLVWNGVVAGFDLDASDVIEFDYSVA